MGLADRLVHIDLLGSVQAADDATALHLRGRAGEWRIEPSPRDLVVLRKLRDDPPCLRLAGKLRTPGALADAVSLVSQAAWGGELIVISDEGTRSVYFEGGNVAGVATTVQDERLGEMLYRFDLITRAQLVQTLTDARVTQRRFGELAMALNFVSAQKLFPVLQAQVETVFFAVLRVGKGMFYLYDRFDETALIHRHNLNTASLLMESARQIDEMRFFRERIPSADYVPVPSPGGRKPPEELQPIYRLCDGRRSVGQIGNRLGMLEFDVTRAVYQLVSGALLAIVPPRPRGPTAIVQVFDAALVEIHARCDAAGRGHDLRDGLARFATGIYERLFAWAGPKADGSLEGMRIAQNLATLAVVDADEWLIELLHEYAGFALFQAESLLPRDVHKELRAAVSERLKTVRPLDSSQPVPSRRSLPPPSRAP